MGWHDMMYGDPSKGGGDLGEDGDTPEKVDRNSAVYRTLARGTVQSVREAVTKLEWAADTLEMLEYNLFAKELRDLAEKAHKLRLDVQGRIVK